VADDDTYYRLRLEDELAAIERATDPAIANVHREMAQRYKQMLEISLHLAVDGPGRQELTGGGFEERRAILG
jgi:hypothetical protein